MKKFLIALGVLLGLLLVAGIAIVILVDVNVYKPRIEAAVSDALGMEFRIEGKAGLRLLPSASIVLSDIRLRNLDTDLATAEALRVGVKLLPLLRRRLEITEIVHQGIRPSGSRREPTGSSTTRPRSAPRNHPRRKVKNRGSPWP